MPTTEIRKTVKYNAVNGGEASLAEIIEVEVEVETQEEIIAKKEEELIAMYNALEALKNK